MNQIERIVSYSHSSKSNEWYTPQWVIDFARALMGDIDLDPCSTAKANETVGAATIFTQSVDGLSIPWAGRVWLNPPYGRETVKWIDKLLSEWKADNVKSACCLVNANTETEYYQTLTRFPHFLFAKRIQFINGHGNGDANAKSPVRGSAMFYIPPDTVSNWDACDRMETMALPPSIHGVIMPPRYGRL